MFCRKQNLDSQGFNASWFSIWTGSASMDSTNCGLKILGGGETSVLNAYRPFSCHYPLINTVEQLFAYHLHPIMSL